MSEPRSIGWERLRFRIELLFGMVRREVLGRYRGSQLGILWTLLAPLLMLAVFTFAFHDLLGARWAGSEGRGGFAVMVFAGLILHGMMAETLARAPVSVTGQSNYVTKLVFPLTVLPLQPVGAALFHATLSLVVLVLFAPLAGQTLHWTGLLVPVMLFPYVLGLCGLAWALAALGVYIRDIAQLGTMLAMMLLFLSPIFFPLSAIPPRYAGIVAANPLTFVVESLRAMLFEGQLPDPMHWLAYTAGALLVAVGGLLLFRRLRPGFGDVL